MANMSDAYGTLTLVGAWTPRLIDNLIRILSMYDDVNYYIAFEYPEDFYKEDHTASFVGIGRWSFASNLELFDHWTAALSRKYKRIRSYRKLIREMYENNLSLLWKVKDEEPGFAFIHNFEGVHTPNAKGILHFEINNEQLYRHTLKNVHDHYIDDLYIEDVLLEINRLTNINTETIFNVMNQDPNWYHIGCWIYSLKDIPPALLKALEDK